MNVKVIVSALVYPTEIQEKVNKAITNFFPVPLKLQDYGIKRIFGEGDLDSLRRLHQHLREERILDTTRHVLLEGLSGNTTQFWLNKQVAFAGKVNFPAGEESLGSINVEISAENEEDIQNIIDWLAPRTVDGKPVEEIEL